MMMEVMFLQLIEGADRNIVDDDGQENHRTSAKGKSKGYFYPSLVKSGNLHFNWMEKRLNFFYSRQVVVSDNKFIKDLPV